MSTYYETLGVAQDATVADIKTAIRRGQRAHHPDVVGEDPEHHKQYLAIMEAAEVLLDEKKRANYDASLAAAPSSGPPPPRSDDSSSSSRGSSSSSPPPPTQAQTQRNPAPDGEPIITDLGPDPRFLGGIVGLLILVDALVSRESFTGSLTAFLVLSVIFWMVGYTNYHPGDSSAPRYRVTWGTSLATVISGILGGLGLIVNLWILMGSSSWTHTLISIVAPLPALYVVCRWLGQLAWWRRHDQKILKHSALRKSWWFGVQSGGIDGAQLTKLLQPIVGRNVRVFMLSHPVYTHMVLAGRHVTFLRYLNGPSGHYTFSGDSLIVEVADGSLHEVGRVDLGSVNFLLSSSLPKESTMSAYIVVPADHVEGSEFVISINQLPAAVYSDTLGLDRSVAVDALVGVATVAP